jgi:hypothetical protein
MAYSVEDLKNIQDDKIAEDEYAKSKEGIYIPRRVTDSFRVIPIVGTVSRDTLRAIHRINSFGSLFYFSAVTLGKHKLQRNPDITKNLHYQMCKSVEKDGVQDVIEIPRDHFKSTIYSECFPMWRALPFTTQDELVFRKIGYGDEFIQWMYRAHRQNYRWLLISEIISNAIKLGVKVSNHYVNNQMFRWVFKEIIPDASCTWTANSLHHKRTPDASGHGEGTYDFMGVGAALQSRHYDGIIQDDLIGKKAMNSETVLADTIEYHKLLVGAMDADHTSGNRDNDELIVGNRWAYNDLNSYIRQNEDYFNFTTHSALGGCCKLHPYGTPIFPEAFDIRKLERWKKRLGTYLFSCQFLNVPINPAEVKFSKKDLRYFEFGYDQSGSVTDKKRRVTIKHHVHEGDVMLDVLPRTLRRFMILDPNHSGNEGRCRHAITVTGVMDDPRRIYLLDVWAKSVGTDSLISTMLHMAYAWKLEEIWMETIAAQKYLKYHLDYVLKVGLSAVFSGEENYTEKIAWCKKLVIKELKTPKTKNAKQMRIDGLGPIIERNELWVNTHGQQEFMEELESYPNGQLRDVLDTLGYGPQVWGFEVADKDIEESVLVRKAKWERETRPN